MGDVAVTSPRTDVRPARAAPRACATIAGRVDRAGVRRARGAGRCRGLAAARPRPDGGRRAGGGAGRVRRRRRAVRRPDRRRGAVARLHHAGRGDDDDVGGRAAGPVDAPGSDHRAAHPRAGEARLPGHVRAVGAGRGRAVERRRDPADDADRALAPAHGLSAPSPQVPRAVRGRGVHRRRRRAARHLEPDEPHLLRPRRHRLQRLRGGDDPGGDRGLAGRVRGAGVDLPRRAGRSGAGAGRVADRARALEPRRADRAR
jgi:hypothetical protein